MWQCSQQHENKEEAKFCSKCGEKRVVDVYCTECGILLDAADLFCTSCGHRRDAETQVMAKPAPVAPIVQVPIAQTPTPVPPPPVVAVPVVQHVVAPAQTVPVTPPPQEARTEEPVSFRFGGALIPMGGQAQRQEHTGRPMVVAAPAGAGIRGMSSTQSAILGFVAIVVVLGLVFYLVGH